MRTFKRIVVLIAAVAFLFCMNAALTFALVPYGSKSELVWTDYASEEHIDTLLIGTSFMQNGIDPELLDKLTGCSSYCLATPSQTLEESLIGIRTASEDHGISRVILGVSAIALREEAPPSLGSAFLSSRARFASVPQQLDAAREILLDYGGIAGADSINALFPWNYNHVSMTPSAIAANVGARLSMTPYEAAGVADPDWAYRGKGYGVVDAVLDYDSDDVQPFYAGVSEIEPDRVATLGDISAYCSEQGIDLILVALPMPAFDIVDGSGYFELHDAFVQIAEDIDCPFYDFNYALPELFEAQPDYFYDTAHLNERGSRVFTESFARFLAARDAGEDLAGLFTDEQGVRAAVDWISAVFADAAADGSGVHVTARAVSGTGVVAEFRLSVLNPATQEWEPVCDWSRAGAFDFTPAGHGVVNLRVEAREAGSDAAFERCRTLQVVA